MTEDPDKAQSNIMNEAGTGTEEASPVMDKNADNDQKEPEEALDSQEVVEINKFTERKEWIEAKIQVGRFIAI